MYALSPPSPVTIEGLTEALLTAIELVSVGKMTATGEGGIVQGSKFYDSKSFVKRSGTTLDDAMEWASLIAFMVFGWALNEWQLAILGA